MFKNIRISIPPPNAGATSTLERQPQIGIEIFKNQNDFSQTKKCFPCSAPGAWYGADAGK